MKSLLRQSAILVGLALLPAVGQAVYYRDKVSWQTPVAASEMVTLAQARESADAIWIDARPQEDFEREHVPGALSLTEDRWNDLLPEVLTIWTPEKRIIVYCSSDGCGSSREIAHRLRKEAGLSNVFVLEGGWEAWKKEKQ